MLLNSKKNILSKIIFELPLFILYLTMIYLTTIYIILSNNINNVGIIAISVFLIALFFSFRRKHENHESYEKYIGLRPIFAIFIDIITSILFIGLFGIISVLLPVIFYYGFAILLSATILGYNVFFTSPGYKLFKIKVYRYKIPVLFYNILFIFCFIGVLKINKLLIYILAGLYFGLDSFFLIIKKAPLVYYVFKITYYRSRSGDRYYNLKCKERSGTEMARAGDSHPNSVVPLGVTVRQI
jgi:hypothetical protein